jgi:hypothetical protein
MANIPEGYELLAGRGRENALKALKLANERGVDETLVRVSAALGGFLVPIGDSTVETDGTDKDLSDLTVADLKAVAAERGVDLGDATKKADIIDKINATPEAPAAADGAETKED